jgi:hypothetical protein
MISDTTPNEQSISRQKMGIPRISPAIKASGNMATAAIIPNSTTQLF